MRLMVNLYAPMPMSALLRFARVMSDVRPGVDCEKRLTLMVKRGELRVEKVDHVNYIWPAAEAMPEAIEDKVHLLAPFDPVVWDRIRFEHLWGWPYRFEAYTPVEKRKLGYYALPLLWREKVIGWANVASGGAKRKTDLKVELGYVAGKPPRGDAMMFKRELAEEIERLREFLEVR